VLEFEGKLPRIEKGVFLAPGAAVVGDVTIEEKASVWFGAVLRGDRCSIRIGRGSNVQDCAVVHTSAGYEVEVGEMVSIAHGAVVHGCRIGSCCLVGMNAVVMNGVEVGEECIVGAGAVLPEHRRYPPRSLILGVPARVVRSLEDSEVEAVRRNAEVYMELARKYLRTCSQEDI